MRSMAVRALAGLALAPRSIALSPRSTTLSPRSTTLSPRSRSNLQVLLRQLLAPACMHPGTLGTGNTRMQTTVRLWCPARMFHSLVQHSPLAVFPHRHAHPAALPASRMDGMPCCLPGDAAQAHLASAWRMS